MRHVRTLVTLTDEILFCFDGDDAGRRAAWRALEQSLEALKDGVTLRFAFLPQGEDPDSFVRSAGPDAFREQLQRSRTLSQYLIETLTENESLDTPEGRARLIHHAQPLIARIAAPELKRQIEQEIAERARIPLDDWAAAATPRVAPRRTRTRTQPHWHATPRKTVATLGTRLLRLLLAHPRLAARVPVNWIDASEDPDLQAAQRLVDAIEHGEIAPEQPLAAILSHFQSDESLRARLESHAAALVEESAPDDTDPESELADLLDALAAQTLQREIAELMAKARVQMLTAEERQRLNTLIREAKRPRNDRRGN